MLPPLANNPNSLNTMTENKENSITTLSGFQYLPPKS
jgi:hypothetical protein